MLELSLKHSVWFELCAIQTSWVNSGMAEPGVPGLSLAQTPLLENSTAIEVQGQAEETDENLGQGPTVAVQAGIEEEKSTPLLQKFTGEKSYILN